MSTYPEINANQTDDTIKPTSSVEGSTPSPSKANVNGTADIAGAMIATTSINTHNNTLFVVIFSSGKSQSSSALST